MTNPRPLRPLLCLLFTLTAQAQTSLPLFGLTPGNSSHDTALQQLQQQQASISGEYYGNAQDAFLSTTPENIPNQHVIVTHAHGLAAAGNSQVQLSFFDDMLFEIRLDYPAPASADSPYQALTARYGPPAGYGSNQAPTYSWPQPVYTVTLQNRLAGGYALIWRHNALARQVATSNAETLAAHVRQKIRLIMPPSP